MSDENESAAPAPGAAGDPAGVAVPPAPDGGSGGSAPAAGAGDGPKAPVTPFYSSLPDDWREQVVEATGYEGEEKEKTLGMLAKFKDLPSAMKSLREAQKKISSGVAKNALPEKPTAEELSAYRAAKGIPETHEGYQISLDEGLAVYDSDKSALDVLLKEAHGMNLGSAEASKMVNAVLKQREAEFESRQQADRLDSQNTAAALKKMWGPDFDRNKNMVKNLLANELPKEILEPFLNARMAGGTGGGVFNSPEVMNFLAKVARELNPAPAIVPVGQRGKSHDQIMADFRAKMGDASWDKSQDRKDYIKYLESYENSRKRAG